MKEVLLSPIFASILLVRVFEPPPARDFSAARTLSAVLALHEALLPLRPAFEIALVF